MLLSALLTVAPVAQGLPDDQERLYRLLQDVDRVTPEVLVMRAVSPSVVYIETEAVQQVNTWWGLRNRRVAGSGSGVVIHADGYIVTNYHVVQDAQKVTVTFDGDPRRYEAEVVSFVRGEDLALLRVTTEDARSEGFPTVRMGSSADLMRGERVVAIGNPHGQAHTVSTGIISGLHRDAPLPDHGLHFENLIQTDASINLGNSGGPLLNINGELIGINTVMNAMAENIGFAIPVDRVREVLTETLFPQAQRRWLGFELAPGDSLRVAEVVPNSPADEAGICEGHRILALAGRPVDSQEDFLHAALELPGSGPVTVRVRTEDGSDEDVRLRPWDRIDGVLFHRLGMTVEERRLNRYEWLVVDEVSPGGPADELGLRRGDLLPAIRPRVPGHDTPLRIRDRTVLAQLVERLEPGIELALEVFRDDDRDGRYEENELYRGTLKVR